MEVVYTSKSTSAKDHRLLGRVYLDAVIAAGRQKEDPYYSYQVRAARVPKFVLHTFRDWRLHCSVMHIEKVAETAQVKKDYAVYQLTQAHFSLECLLETVRTREIKASRSPHS